MRVTCTTDNRRNCLTGRYNSIIHAIIRYVSTMTLSIQDITNGGLSRVILNSSISSRVILGRLSVQILFSSNCRQTLCLNANEILIIRCTILQITTFTIRIRATIKDLIRVGTPIRGLLGLNEYIFGGFLCDFCVTCTITNGRDVLGIFLVVICCNIYCQQCAALYRYYIYLIRNNFTRRHGLTLIHRFRNGTRANCTTTGSWRVRFTGRFPVDLWLL